MKTQLFKHKFLILVFIALATGLISQESSKAETFFGKGKTIRALDFSGSVRTCCKSSFSMDCVRGINDCEMGPIL